MVIFLNEERGYLNWVTHNRLGYVLDGFWKPKISHLVMHRASCGDVRKSGTHTRAHWTTGRKLKACSDQRQELEDWSVAEVGIAPSFCVNCEPDKEVTNETNGQPHLSKLSADILDYVLDAALIHMEHEYPPYQLTLNDIAGCFRKTPAQISPAVRKLTEGGLLFMLGKISDSTRLLHGKRIVLPTTLGLKTLEAFQNESDGAIQFEVDKLRLTALGVW